MRMGGGGISTRAHAIRTHKAASDRPWSVWLLWLCGPSSESKSQLLRSCLSKSRNVNTILWSLALFGHLAVASFFSAHTGKKWIKKLFLRLILQQWWGQTSAFWSIKCPSVYLTTPSSPTSSVYHPQTMIFHLSYHKGTIKDEMLFCFSFSGTTACWQCSLSVPLRSFDRTSN